MDDKIDSLIQEISTKHGVVIGRDDPILILHSVNMRLIEQSAMAQREILNTFREEMESISSQWADDAKAKAEKMLNAALAVSKEAMARMMQESGNTVAEQVRREFEAARSQLAATIRETRRVATMNMTAAGLTVFAAIIVLWAAL